MKAEKQPSIEAPSQEPFPAPESLPKYMEARPMKRGGTSFRVRLPDGTKRGLGWNLQEALAEYRRLMPVEQHADSEELARVLFEASRKSAAARGLEFLLTIDQVLAIVRRADGKCEVSGRRFSNAKSPGQRVRPWAASLDRIDSRVGYMASNCRLVCAAVNLALNQFGEDVLVEIARGIVARRPTVVQDPRGF